MNDSRSLPGAAERWLRRVSTRLGTFDPALRNDIVEGLRSHLAESLDAGEPVDAALARLGAPKLCAARILNEQQEATGRTLTGYRMNAKRVVQFAAFALMVGAVLAIIFLPTYSSVTATSSSSDPAGHVVVASQTALEVNGPAILVFLAVPLLAAAAPLLATGRGWQPVSVGSALLLMACTIIAAATIGVFILPATIAAATAAFLPTSSRRGRGQTKTGNCMAAT